MSMLTGTGLVDECRGCTRISSSGKVCLAISDPEGLWRSSGCWAYTADPHWYKKFMEASEKYAGK